MFDLDEENNTKQYELGKQDSAQWSVGSDAEHSVSISYYSGAKRAHVILICSQNGSAEFEAIGEGPANNYKFRLTHRCACWDECDSE